MAQKQNKTFTNAQSVKYFTDMRDSANIALFNLKHKGISSVDPKVLEKALQNLVKYSNKSLAALTEAKKEQ